MQSKGHANHRLAKEMFRRAVLSKGIERKCCGKVVYGKALARYGGYADSKGRGKHSLATDSNGMARPGKEFPCSGPVLLFHAKDLSRQETMGKAQQGNGVETIGNGRAGTGIVKPWNCIDRCGRATALSGNEKQRYGLVKKRIAKEL